VSILSGDIPLGVPELGDSNFSGGWSIFGGGSFSNCGSVCFCGISGGVGFAGFASIFGEGVEEAAVVATELIRFGLLNSQDMFPSYSGKLSAGDDIVDRNSLLIARVASLLRLEHQEIGYSGPLSRDLLGFHSMTTAIRDNLRDMHEVCLVSLLFNGDVVRDRQDYGDLGFDLPFLLPTNSALSLAVLFYLIGLNTAPLNAEQSVPNAKNNFLRSAKTTLMAQAVNLEADLEKAFKLWDAVFAGLKVAVAEGLVPHGKDELDIWEAADKWLKTWR